MSALTAAWSRSRRRDRWRRARARRGTSTGSPANAAVEAAGPGPLLMVAALVVVFAWVLPQFIDYDDAGSALRQLDAWELVALVALALAPVRQRR